MNTRTRPKRWGTTLACLAPLAAADGTPVRRLPSRLRGLVAVMAALVLVTPILGPLGAMAQSEPEDSLVEEPVLDATLHLPVLEPFADVTFRDGTEAVVLSQAPAGVAFTLFIDGIDAPWLNGEMVLEANGEVVAILAIETAVVIAYDVESYVGPAYKITLQVPGSPGLPPLTTPPLDLTSVLLQSDECAPVAPQLLENRVADPASNSRYGEVAAVLKESVRVACSMPVLAMGCQGFSTGTDYDIQYAAGQQASIGTTARILTYGNNEEDWTYWSHPYGYDFRTSVPDAYSFGHGFRGANKYTYGDSFDIAFAGSWEGSKDVDSEYVNECRAHIQTGHRFTVEKVQVLYRDPTGVIAVHDDAWEKGRPSSSCSSTLPTLLKDALAQTKYGGFIAAAIPDKWCTKNWSEIESDAFGASGLGVEMDRAAQNWYEGGEGYIRTSYSSTGKFKMQLDGLALVYAWMNACGRCTPYMERFWDPFALRAYAQVVAPS